jgi:hypothetical protein
MEKSNLPTRIRTFVSVLFGFILFFIEQSFGDTCTMEGGFDIDSRVRNVCVNLRDVQNSCTIPLLSLENLCNTEESSIAAFNRM